MAAAVGAQWQPLRSYRLTQGYATFPRVRRQRLLLLGVAEQGADGTLLRQTTFAYKDCKLSPERCAAGINGVRLEIVDLIEALPYAYVPVEVIQKLTQLPRTEMLACLRGLTRSENMELSDRAMCTIFELDPGYGRTVLLELWNNPTWEWFFCYAALDYGDDAFVHPLCEILRNSQNSNTRYMAAVALEWHGNASYIDW